VSSNPVINRNDKSSNPDLTGEDVNHQNKDKQAARNISIEGDDVISGFSFVSGQIETSGGLTFFVFKEGERTNAAVWGMNSMRIHYLCDNKSICKLSHVGSDVVLHAKLRK
jgi:hypothetical protein